MGEFFNLTVDFELSRVSDRPGRVHGPAGVDARVPIPDTADDQDAGSGSNHGGGQGRLRRDDSSVQGPGDGERFITLSD